MIKPPRIHVDFEARSLINLLKLGADVYARHWSTSITMLSIVAPHVGVSYVEDFLLGVPGYQQSVYPFAKPGDIHFRMIKPACPPVILQAIREGWVFVAHNARFEQTMWYHICHLQWGWPMPLNWSCTAARSRYWGIRASLEGSGSDLEIVHQKNADGKEFINNFCKPRKWKGAQKLGIVKELWYEPQDDPAGWQRGLQYCLDDGYAEMEIDALLPDLPPFEQAVWDLDFKINIRGLPIDTVSVERAILFSDYFTEYNFKRFDEITALRPTQRDKVLEYINQREEIEQLGDLRSKTLKRLTQSEMSPELRDVVQIRLETSKASIKKLETMKACTDSDGRARGLFLYGGAHTMRWSAKRIQPQNFTRPNPDAPANFMFDYLQSDCWSRGIGDNGGPPLDELPQQPEWVVEAGMRFLRPLNYLSTSMRGFIQAPKGFKLVVGDYAQIEARVLAWIARCMWLLEAFGRHDDVYTRFAGDHMYHRPYDEYFEVVGGKRKIKKIFARERQIAKSAVLGCGFGLGAPKFVEYCDNSDLIITLEESETTIKAYRSAHIEIADRQAGIWARLERAAIIATAEWRTWENRVELGGTGISYHVHRIDDQRYWLVCTLPSGRHIAYYRPKVRLGTKWGRTCEILSFRTEWNGKSYREDTYGGKLTENTVQAIARDVCATGALNAEAAGYPLIGLVHDELITLPPLDFGTPEGLCTEMCRLPAWITDLPVEAEGGTMDRYGK